jgi:hypothetical protein
MFSLSFSPFIFFFFVFSQREHGVHGPFFSGLGSYISVVEVMMPLGELSIPFFSL